MTTKPVTRDQVFAELTPIFRDLFEDPALTPSDKMTAKDVTLWDSLNHINLLIAIEQKFGIKFSTAEIARLANVGQLVDVILKKKSA